MATGGGEIHWGLRELVVEKTVLSVSRYVGSPRRIGLTVIDDLPEMIGWVKGLFNFFVGTIMIVFSFAVPHPCEHSKITIGFDLVNDDSAI